MAFGYDEGAGTAWEVALALGPSVMESAVIPAHLYLTTDGGIVYGAFVTNGPPFLLLLLHYRYLSVM